MPEEQTMQYMRAVVNVGDTRAHDGPSREDLLKDASLPVPFTASTEGVKADGMDLKMAEWDLRRFKRYGPILWLHNYWRPPIGTGKARVEDDLMIDVLFDEADPFAMEVRGKAINGMMAGSVGWATVQGKGQKIRNHLMEFSMTPMGLDPDALPAIGRMNDTLREGMTRALSTTEEGLTLEKALLEIRDEILTGLQTVLDEFIVEDGRHETDEQEEEETTLEDEATENRDGDEDLDDERAEQEEETASVTSAAVVTTATTSSEELHLFWDGQQMVSTDEIVRENSPEEILQRAGAVLSQKNRDDLEAARKLIAGVIDRATPDDDEMFVALKDDDERNVEPGEAADDGLVSEKDERDENEGLSPDLVLQIEEVLANKF